MTEKEEETGKYLSSSGLLPIRLQQLGWVGPETKLHPGFLCVYKGLMTWAIFYCIQSILIKEQDQK